MRERSDETVHRRATLPRITTIARVFTSPMGKRSLRRARVLAVSALIALPALLALPASAGAFSKAIWGQVYRNGVNQFPLYHRLGVTIFQIALDWSQAAPTRPADPANSTDPAYRWPSELDQAIAQAK